jgi:hypothetical protein
MSGSGLPANGSPPIPKRIGSPSSNDSGVPSAVDNLSRSSASPRIPGASGHLYNSMADDEKVTSRGMSEGGVSSVTPDMSDSWDVPESWIVNSRIQPSHPGLDDDNISGIAVDYSDSMTSGEPTRSPQRNGATSSTTPAGNQIVAFESEESLPPREVCHVDTSIFLSSSSHSFSRK